MPNAEPIKARLFKEGQLIAETEVMLTENEFENMTEEDECEILSLLFSLAEG